MCRFGANYERTIEETLCDVVLLMCEVCVYLWVILLIMRISVSEIMRHYVLFMDHMKLKCLETVLQILSTVTMLLLVYI